MFLIFPSLFIIKFVKGQFAKAPPPIYSIFESADASHSVNPLFFETTPSMILEQLLKALFPIFTKLYGRFNLPIFSHPLKASFSIISRLSGNLLFNSKFLH